LPTPAERIFRDNELAEAAIEAEGRLVCRIVGYRDVRPGRNDPGAVQALVEVLETNDALGLDAGAVVSVSMAEHPSDGNVLVTELMRGCADGEVPPCRPPGRGRPRDVTGISPWP
jgi:hypothetical protein